MINKNGHHWVEDEGYSFCIKCNTPKPIKVESAPLQFPTLVDALRITA